MFPSPLGFLKPFVALQSEGTIRDLVHIMSVFCLVRKFQKGGEFVCSAKLPTHPSEISLVPSMGPGPVFTEWMDFFFFFFYFCPVAFSAAQPLISL